MTLQLSPMINSDNSEDKWMSSVRAFLDKSFLSQADDCDLRTLGVLSSLILINVQREFNHRIYFLKMSRGYSVTPRDGHLPQYSPRWMNWGYHVEWWMLNSRNSKQEASSFLSDILENEVSDHYFLYEYKVAQLILND